MKAILFYISQVPAEQKALAPSNWTMKAFYIIVAIICILIFAKIVFSILDYSSINKLKKHDKSHNF